MAIKKIILADSQKIIIEGIKKIFEGYNKVEIAGEAYDGKKAQEIVYSMRPDLVIMDVALPLISGVEAAANIKRELPETLILIFTLHSEKEYVARLLPLGIEGFVLKDDTSADLLQAVRVILAGATYFSKTVINELGMYLKELKNRDVSDNPLRRLSTREKEVFTLLADGNSIKRIAKRLCISAKTVETHKYNIMKKLDIRSIPDLVKYAIRNNIIKS